MLVAFNVVAVVRAFVKTARTLNDISGFDLRLASREVRKEYLLGVAVLARETKVPLSGGKRTHSLGPRLGNWAMRNGA
jgi:hypothetical protein